MSQLEQFQVLLNLTGSKPAIGFLESFIINMEVVMSQLRSKHQGATIATCN